MALTKFSLLKRRSDLTPAQFSEHWRTTHARVLVEQGAHKKYNKRYVQNHFIYDSGLGFCSDAFDGAAQMIPQSADVLRSGFQEDPRYQQFVRPDEERFLDVSRCVVLYCESHAVLAHPHSGGVKLLSFTKRSAVTSHAQFMQAWRERHAPLAQGLPDFWGLVRGYTQHEVLQEATRAMANGERGNPDMAYDGVAELQFDSLSDLQAAFSSAGYRDVLRADTATFKDAASSAFLAHEVLVYEEV